ncbi:MAG: FAD-dependent oxidoreductase, partial [Azospirillaceae bacterium]
MTHPVGSNGATTRHDVVIVGGGIMGCTTALHLARGGMSVAVLEKGGLCMQASGVNAGTLSIQIKRAALIPYAMRGWEQWRDAPDWLGDVGFGQRGGVTLAFTAEEAAMLEERMQGRIAQGAPIEMVGANRARELEPGLSDKVVSASFCPLDGYSNSSVTGHAYRLALREAGAELREYTEVTGIERVANGYRVATAGGPVEGTRLVLAGGAWLGDLLERDFGLHLPVNRRINQVTVTERMPMVVNRIVGVATGLLTLK